LQFISSFLEYCFVGFLATVEALCLLAIIQPFLHVILLICQVPKLLPSERNMAAPVNLGDVVNLGGTVAVDVSVFFFE